VFIKALILAIAPELWVESIKKGGSFQNLQSLLNSS